MGTSCSIILLKLEASDWIDLLGILANLLLAFWIVRTIQDKLTNKRVLKDHFINELKEIRIEYKTCLNNLYLNQTNAKRVIPWFKLMNIKVDDLMKLIYDKYQIDMYILRPYQNELRDMLTENADFVKQYESPTPVIFSEDSKNKLIIFQQVNNHLFNDIIIQINDA